MYKKFHEKWTEAEIFDYIDEHNVLVLFEPPPPPGNEVRLNIYGKIDKEQKAALYLSITEEFGGEGMSEELCDWVNSFAQWWYERKNGPRRIRLINF